MTSIQVCIYKLVRLFLVRQVFKGDNYSREESIRGNTVIKSLADIHHGNDLILFILFNRKSHFYPTPLVLIILTSLDLKEYYSSQRNIKKETDAERNVYQLL